MVSVNLPSQLDMPLQIAHKSKQIEPASKEELGIRLAKLLRK